MRKVKRISRDIDGWWIEYNPGWKSNTDPMGCVHGEHEDTEREVLELAQNALRCDCFECSMEEESCQFTHHLG